MKWLKTQPPSPPAYGTEVMTTRFLWWPRAIDGQTRWLETATILWRYSEMGFSVFGDEDEWVAVRWCDEFNDNHP